MGTPLKKWYKKVSDHSHRVGFVSPASYPIRWLALNNAATAWLIPSLGPKIEPFELFLVNGDLRQSGGVVYGLTGDLQRTTEIVFVAFAYGAPM